MPLNSTGSLNFFRVSYLVELQFDYSSSSSFIEIEKVW